MTWTVSSPESSSKNQPQLVYISMAWRCISRSLSAAIFSAESRSRVACCARKDSASSISRFRITSM
jgi:hypothetical protein